MPYLYTHKAHIHTHAYIYVCINNAQKDFAHIALLLCCSYRKAHFIATLTPPNLRVLFPTSWPTLMRRITHTNLCMPSYTYTHTNTQTYIAVIEIQINKIIFGISHPNAWAKDEAAYRIRRQRGSSSNQLF